MPKRESSLKLINSKNSFFTKNNKNDNIPIDNKLLNNPIAMLLIKNGERINDLVAPTSFIVLITNRLEYIDKRIVLLIRV